MRERIKVIYIGPTGRSGTTLLDLLLNNHREIQSLGELMFLDKWLSQDLLCSCGKKISSCSFWNKIFENLPEKTNFRLDYNDPPNKISKILNNLVLIDIIPPNRIKKFKIIIIDCLKQ